MKFNNLKIHFHFGELSEKEEKKYNFIPNKTYEDTEAYEFLQNCKHLTTELSKKKEIGYRKFFINFTYNQFTWNNARLEIHGNCCFVENTIADAFQKYVEKYYKMNTDEEMAPHYADFKKMPLKEYLKKIDQQKKELDNLVEQFRKEEEQYLKGNNDA